MRNTKYDDQALQEINNSVNLLEYVSQYLNMEKRGKDYWASCPLHVDKTPSFSITPEKNSYYCFSCGRSGGIIGYLMEYEGLPFDDAVEKAARLANVDLSKMCRSETIMFLRKLKIFSEKRHTETFIHPVLPESRLDKYEKTYPQEWIDEGIQRDMMDLFGVRVDNWQNRIVYPVRDIDGKLINIKGRTRYKDYKAMGIPKYMNYEPIGVMDYFQGLDVTLPYVNQQHEMIIFESHKSVMKAFGWGIKHVVSAEKHNLTDEQIMLVVKLRVNVVLAYDSDMSYSRNDISENIEKLRRVTNVFVMEDKQGLLGGASTKNAPADLGEDVFRELYAQKKKVV